MGAGPSIERAHALTLTDSEHSVRGVYFNPASVTRVRPCNVSTSRFTIGAAIVFLEVDSGPDFGCERHGIVASEPRLGDGGRHFYRVHRTVEDAMGERVAVHERPLVVAERDLLSKQEVRDRHLRKAMGKLYGVIFGHAVKRWICFTREARDHEEAMTAALLVQAHFRGVVSRRYVVRKKASLSREAIKARKAWEAEQLRLSIETDIAEAKERRRLAELARKKPAWEIEADAYAATLGTTEPHYSSLGVRIPGLPKTGSECTLSGVIRVTDSHAHVKFKKIISGPLDRSNWIVKGRVLLGAFPRDDMQAEIGATAKAHGHMVGTIISQGIGNFVCCMTQEELDSLPPRAQTSTGTTVKQHAVGDFPSIFRLYCGRMKDELRNGVAATEKALELSQTMRNRALDEGYAADILTTYTDRLRYAEKCHKIVKTKFDHVPEPTALRFAVLPWKDGEVIANEALLASLKQTEGWLREGGNVYVFSRNGRGRAGVYASCLLGRLYGLHADDALGRLQIYHDTRRSLKKGDAGDKSHHVALSTPSTAVQSHMVRGMLNTYSSVFSSREVLTTDLTARSVTRHRKRGTAQLVYDKISSPTTSSSRGGRASPAVAPRGIGSESPGPPLSPRKQFGDASWDAPAVEEEEEGQPQPQQQQQQRLAVPTLDLTAAEPLRCEPLVRTPRVRSEPLATPATGEDRRARVAALRAQVHAIAAEPAA